MKTNHAITAVISSVLMLISFGAVAQGTKDKAEKAKTAGDRVDISDLENKYWAPKDTDFSVVQNRTYTKEKRFSLSAGYGILVNDSYSDANIFDLTANYYFSERYGIELSYSRADIEEGEVISNLSQFAGGVRPNFSQLDQMYELGFNYVPFYAKVSVLGKKIIYFDMMITPTIGLVDYNNKLQITSGLGAQTDKAQQSFSYGFNISQHFFISKRITIRADIKNRWFNEKRTPWTVSDRNSGVSLGEVYNNTTTFTLGLQYFF